MLQVMADFHPKFLGVFGRFPFAVHPIQVLEQNRVRIDLISKIHITGFQQVTQQQTKK